jgi:hypothetical protein
MIFSYNIKKIKIVLLALRAFFIKKCPLDITSINTILYLYAIILNGSSING